MGEGDHLAEFQAEFPSARRSELLRFLRARRGNLAQARAQYVQHLAWRSKMLPIAAKDCTEVLASGVIYSLPGEALDGSSVIVFHGPRHNPKRFATSETLKAIVHVATSAFKSRDPDDVRFTLILFAPKGTPFDLGGIAALASVMSQNFPETLVSTVVFPCGRFTAMLWEMAKHFLDARTAAKVVLLTEESPPAQLTQIFPVEILPTQFVPRSEIDELRRRQRERERATSSSEEGSKAGNTATAPVLVPVAAVEANEIGDPYVASSTFLACASCALLSDLTVANALAAAATAAIAAWLLSWWYRRFQDKEHAQHSNDGRGGGHSTVRTAAGAGT
jgi:hypothetical protein